MSKMGTIELVSTHGLHDGVHITANTMHTFFPIKHDDGRGLNSRLAV